MEWNEPSGKTDLAQLPTRDQHKSNQDNEVLDVLGMSRPQSILLPTGLLTSSATTTNMEQLKTSIDKRTRWGEGTLQEYSPVVRYRWRLG